jgi:hypothetical protein
MEPLAYFGFAKICLTRFLLRMVLNKEMRCRHFFKLCFKICHEEGSGKPEEL